MFFLLFLHNDDDDDDDGKHLGFCPNVADTEWSILCVTCH